MVKNRVGNRWKAQTVMTSRVLVLKRMYATNKNNMSFRRMLVTIKKYDDSTIPYPTLIHYYWVEGDRDFNLRPYRKDKEKSQPYIMSKPSLLKSFKTGMKDAPPAKVYTNYRQSFSDAGGLDCKDLMPRNSNQLYNLNRGEANRDELADLITQQQDEERDGPKFLRKILIDQVCGPVCINYMY